MSEIRAKSEIKLDNGITWTFVKGNKLDYVINILSGGEYQQLQATNQQLVEALEHARMKGYSIFPEGYYITDESVDLMDKAITNAKQVMGDKG